MFKSDAYAWVSEIFLPKPFPENVIELQSPLLLRLMKDQKSALVAEMEKSLEDIRKKDGLEKAIKDFMKNPSMGVPVDMR